MTLQDDLMAHTEEADEYVIVRGLKQLPSEYVPEGHPNQPFLMARKDDPTIVAVCIPTTIIRYAFCYMLDDGAVIYGEGKRVNDGSGWRIAEPGEFDGRVIGRIVTFLRNYKGRWNEMGRCELAG